MKYICLLWFFKKVLSSNINTYEGLCILNNSILKDKDNDDKIQKDCNKKMRIEKECDATVDSDESFIDVGSEEYEMKYLQNVYTTDEKFKQDACIDDTTTTSLRSFNNDPKDIREKELTKSSFPEPLDLSCKYKNSLVCQRSDALQLDNTVVYNSTNADTLDKNVDLNLLEALKNNNSNVLSSYTTIANTSTDDVFRNYILQPCPICAYLSFVRSRNTTLDDEQELENLLRKLEKRFSDLMKAEEKPEFSNKYIIDVYKILNYDKLNFIKNRNDFRRRFYQIQRDIILCIPNILEQLRHQQISENSCILIEKVLNFIKLVFVFVNDCKFCGIKELIEQPYFDNRFKYQEYKFLTLFSDSIFSEMITLVERIRYRSQSLDPKKENLFYKYFKCLRYRIKYIVGNLGYYTYNANKINNFFMKFRTN